MCFKDVAAVAGFAREMGAADKLEAIVATARPTLVFTPGRCMHADRGGGDMIYVLIHDDDLKARRFDNTETVTVRD